VATNSCFSLFYNCYIAFWVVVLNHWQSSSSSWIRSTS
jgi:hypothetical protein